MDPCQLGVPTDHKLPMMGSCSEEQLLTGRCTAEPMFTLLFVACCQAHDRLQEAGCPALLSGCQPGAAR